ncbi:uncharacterized protein EDB93DRAFT_1255632 [Suillus bovinus]|uniref:uncharacterized protein n=1 Tax=Suillus bovinus TaxID=48563 RepID=UPI001B87568E|nr:uncharacterized protein EDB93DRAFT_1255632 [Suillus bovinus]KAG2130976.1 hypothetical protein EDB93DRAFT_1255632 [Suillus bovinus]
MSTKNYENILGDLQSWEAAPNYWMIITMGHYRVFKQKEDNEEPNDPDHTQDLAEMHLSGVQPIITAIHATDLTLGLQQIPTGFHTLIKADNVEYQTSNISVNVDQAIIKWHEHTPLYVIFNLSALQGFHMDADAAEELLSEVLDVSHANSHICRAALIAIETYVLHSVGSIDTDDLWQEWAITSMLPLLLNQLADQAKRCLEGDEPCILDEVISLHYDALRYYNTWHACRGQLQGNLAVILETCFCRQGNDEDMDQAIALQTEVLVLFLIGHTDWFMSLNNLATQLSICFHHRGNDKDLDQAITYLREALALCPVGHIDRSTLSSNLAVQLSSHFEHRGNNKDLEQAITLDREVLALHPVGHTEQSMSLNNLAFQLSTRFEHRGNNKDLK